MSFSYAVIFSFSGYSFFLLTASSSELPQKENCNFHSSRKHLNLGDCKHEFNSPTHTILLWINAAHLLKPVHLETSICAPANPSMSGRARGFISVTMASANALWSGRRGKERSAKQPRKCPKVHPGKRHLERAVVGGPELGNLASTTGVPLEESMQIGKPLECVRGNARKWLERSLLCSEYSWIIWS